jgi:S-adenosylmethionine:tRNA ribosyltransferase-isomerase
VAYHPETLEELGWEFELPPELHAAEPPEARGLARDEVRLLVSYRSTDQVIHTRFRDIPAFLQAGDALIVNTSGTMSASLHGILPDGTQVQVHLSTHLPGDIWTVELRTADGSTTFRGSGSLAGARVRLAGGGSMVLHAPYRCGCASPSEPRETRLWMATLDLPSPTQAYLTQYGSPIRYPYVKEQWPISYYQSAYATEVGSAEMPSAGRAFTPQLLTQLMANGVHIGPLVLHTGVASLEAHEPPYEEFYRVPLHTARLVNSVRDSGRRVIAVGTTVVRTLETVADEEGTVHPGEGWTCTVVTPERGVRSVDGLLTGLHEPRSTHLAMLEALADREHLQLAYHEALRGAYLWHEFGDLHLLLP